MSKVTQERWIDAQVSESQYWNGINITTLLNSCSDKLNFLNSIEKGNQILPSLFDSKEILEIGVGPLGISCASFYPNKQNIKRLVKVEPLQKKSIEDLPLMQQTWARPFLEWVNSLSEEGDYINISGKQMSFDEEFDTVITSNVLDHVQNPLSVLQNAYNSLRENGKILVAVDCRSVLGRIKFEYILRKLRKGTILVEAHPHTFLPNQVVSLLHNAGFQEVQIIGLPNFFDRITGKSFRPAFIAKKIN